MDGMAFDPWKLFGLKSTSSLDEARRAYYKLAIIMHPDKGGNANDMRALYEAYAWIYKQLHGASFPVSVDDPSKTPIIDTVMGMDKESLETFYEKIKPNDDLRTKTVALDWVKYLVERDLMTDKSLKNLEEYVQEGIDVVLQANNQDACYHASIPEGYGSYMDVKDNCNDDYNSIIKQTQNIHIENKSTDDSHTSHNHHFSKDIMIYTEPICPSEIYNNRNMISTPSAMNDYSDVTKELDMTDYALAHTPHVISDTKRYIQEQLEKNNFDKVPYHYQYE